MVGYSPGAVSYAHESVVARVPWYRTRRGIIIIAAIMHPGYPSAWLPMDSRGLRA